MMKKLFFAMIFMLTGMMVTSQTFTVTISGTVNDINGDNPPIEGQMVFINTDSISESGVGIHINTSRAFFSEQESFKASRVLRVSKPRSIDFA